MVAFQIDSIIFFWLGEYHVEAIISLGTRFDGSLGILAEAAIGGSIGEFFVRKHNRSGGRTILNFLRRGHHWRGMDFLIPYLDQPRCFAGQDLGL